MVAFRFRKFQIYKDAKELHKEIVLLTNKFPKKFRYLEDQLNRSSLSVVLNIAEGSAKRSDKDFNRYLENALGSINETVAGLEVTLDLRLITPQRFEELEERYKSLANQVGGFSRTLLKKN